MKTYLKKKRESGIGEKAQKVKGFAKRLNDLSSTNPLGPHGTKQQSIPTKVHKTPQCHSMFTHICM